MRFVNRNHLVLILAPLIILHSTRLCSATLQLGIEMIHPRSAHTATLLPDGTVLVTGGMGQAENGLTSSERYLPARHRFIEAGSMRQGRQSHTATLLHDGSVLVAGGFDNGYLASSEIYNPRTSQFVYGPVMNIARSGHTQTLLPDGRVLMLGGVGEGWNFLNSAEIYDPAAGRFTLIGFMLRPRESHTATLLTDGKVLIAGGHNGRRGVLHIEDTAEIFDPLTGRSEFVSSMGAIRHKHDAIRLRDNSVLIIGGADERDSAGSYRTAELYHPKTRTFTPVGDMSWPRYKLQGTSLMMSDGSVGVFGGASRPERFDPAQNNFIELGDSIVEPRMFATATLLRNGEVLLAGGYGPQIKTSRRAWVLRP